MIGIRVGEDPLGLGETGQNGAQNRDRFQVFFQWQVMHISQVALCVDLIVYL